MYEKLTRSILMTPDIDEKSYSDNRGVIATYYPPYPIVEFNLLVFNKGMTRGEHIHPHFFEIFGVCDDNSGVFVCVDISDGKKYTYLLSKGNFVVTPPNVPHCFLSLGQTTCISMLSKKWKDSIPPITRYEVMSK